MVQEVLDIIMQKDTSDVAKCEPVDVNDTKLQVQTNPENNDKGDSNLLHTNTMNADSSEPYPVELFTNKCKEFNIKQSFVLLVDVAMASKPQPSKSEPSKQKACNSKIPTSHGKDLKLVITDYYINYKIPKWFDTVVVIEDSTFKVSLPKQTGTGNDGKSTKNNKEEMTAKASKPKKQPCITTKDGTEIMLKYNTHSSAKKANIDNVLQKWVREDELDASEAKKTAEESSQKSQVTKKKSKAPEANKCTTSDVKTTEATKTPVNAKEDDAEVVMSCTCVLRSVTKQSAIKTSDAPKKAVPQTPKKQMTQKKPADQMEITQVIGALSSGIITRKRHASMHQSPSNQIPVPDSSSNGEEKYSGDAESDVDSPKKIRRNP